MIIPLLVFTVSCILNARGNPVDVTDHDGDEEEEFTCSRTYKLLQCQNEDFNRTILINFRKNFNWNHSPESVHRIACLCNAEAQKRGFPYFGLSFFGLCNGMQNYDPQDHLATCVNGNLGYCNLDIDQECDGGSLTEALYRTGKIEDEEFIAHPTGVPVHVAIPDENTSLQCPDGYPFKKLACQQEDFERTVLFNDRNLIQWGNFTEWLKVMVCKCRVYAKVNQFEYFSVSFYGICGGLDKHGNRTTTTAQHCQRSVTGSETENTCDLEEEGVPCAGIGYSDVVYSTATHPCDSEDNAGCEDKCNRNADTFYCSCYEGFKLAENERDCVEEE